MIFGNNWEHDFFQNKLLDEKSTKIYQKTADKVSVLKKQTAPLVLCCLSIFANSDAMHRVNATLI